MLYNFRGGVIDDKDDDASIDVATMKVEEGGEGGEEKICIIGSGNWGCAIATVLGRNAARLPFCDDKVNMWVFDEQVVLPSDKTTSKLSDVINTLHENIKYLPGVTLPSNVIAIPDLKEACKNATLVREFSFNCIVASFFCFLTRLLLLTRRGLSSHSWAQQSSCL
jgi:hypothetical protein